MYLHKKFKRTITFKRIFLHSTILGYFIVKKSTILIFAH